MPYKKEFCLFLLEFKKYFISLHSVAGDTLQRKYQHDIIENNRSVMLDLPIGNLRNFLTERKRVWWFTPYSVGCLYHSCSRVFSGPPI